MITKELKDQWVAALRSGDYKQGERALCEPINDEETAFAHCCLGVLAEVAGVDRCRLFGNEHLDKVGLTHLLGPWWNNGESTLYEPSQPQSTLQRKLAALNDTGNDFFAIADWIEANVPVEA